MYTGPIPCNSLENPLNLLTFCVLVLKNGFTVTGESACASPENFDAEVGRKVARQNAVNKIWPLLGYALKDRLHRRAVFDAEPKTGQPPVDNAHVAPGCELFVATSISFDEFVQYGRDNGTNIVNGMPWSFSYKGNPVTHENDQRYIVGIYPHQVNFTPDHVLVIGADGKPSLQPVALKGGAA
jgi:hypothetical protein